MSKTTQDGYFLVKSTDFKNTQAIKFEDRRTCPKRKFLYFATCMVNIASFAVGTSFGWTSPEIPILKSNTSSNPFSTPITVDEESWISSLLPLGALIGSFAVAICDKIGRKNAIILFTLPLIIGYGMAAFVKHVYVLYVMRFLCGLDSGIISAVVPIYVAEIADDKVRGALGSLMVMFMTIGLIFSYTLGPILDFKIFNLVCMIPGFIAVIICYVFIPESPFYLVKKDRKAARKALAKFRGAREEEVEDELNEIAKNMRKSDKNSIASFMNIFKSRASIKALIISVGLVSFSQLCGINNVIFSSQEIFNSTGSTTIPDNISSIILGVVIFLSGSVCSGIVERMGKRFLLLLSSLGCFVSLGALALFFYLKSIESTLIDKMALIPIISLVCFVISYSIGLGPFPFPMMAELLPGDIRSFTISVASIWACFLIFILLKYFVFITEIIGNSGSFGIFSLFSLGSAFFVYKLVPETTGKSFQEIQNILAK